MTDNDNLKFKASTCVNCGAKLAGKKPVDVEEAGPHPGEPNIPTVLRAKCPACGAYAPVSGGKPSPEPEPEPEPKPEPAPEPEPEPVQVICPTCGQQVEAVALERRRAQH